jgi:hypothetical protein
VDNLRAKKVFAVFLSGKSSDTAVSIAELLTEDSGRFYAKKTPKNFLEAIALLERNCRYAGCPLPIIKRVRIGSVRNKFNAGYTVRLYQQVYNPRRKSGKYQQIEKMLYIDTRRQQRRGEEKQQQCRNADIPESQIQTIADCGAVNILKIFCGIISVHNYRSPPSFTFQ